VRKGHGGQIRKAMQLLMSAKRPYIYTGGGVLLSNASPELRALVDMLNFPVTNTLMGLGAFPANDRRFLGMLGMHGTLEANNAMQNCDVLFEHLQASQGGRADRGRRQRRVDRADGHDP
jgi:acetolactate synthase-1/2/3 large subunit